MLTFEELMNYLSGVRLGVSLNILPDVSVYTLNKLMIFTQPAHLDQAAGEIFLMKSGTRIEPL